MTVLLQYGGYKVMQEKTINNDGWNVDFAIEGEKWQLHIAKSQTKITDIRQLRLMTEVREDFVPVEVEDDEDTFTFEFHIDKRLKKWEQLQSLERNDKLRLLCNIARLKKYLHTRVCCFLHPDNIVFNDNLMPLVVYRGIRDLLPPFKMDEIHFLKQLQCLSIALISNEYSFDQLYYGGLKEARGTTFEKQISEMNDIDDLIHYLDESYVKEQQKVENTMRMVPAKRHQLFKRLSIFAIVASVLLAAPLVYVLFFTNPYNEKLLSAHEKYIASDYQEVISVLRKENAEKLPKATKYLLAHAYIEVGQLSDADKKSIMNNVSLKSDDNYLLYWIYDGRGEFDEALDIAKFMDDPQLIMYGIIQKLEAIKNDPNLSGEERDEETKALTKELKELREEYGLEEENETKNEDKRENETKDNDSKKRQQNSSKKEEKSQKEKDKKE